MSRATNARGPRSPRTARPRGAGPRIHVITDLEGAAMVFRFDQTRVAEPTAAKLEAMRILTGEVNACVDGILDADPAADVVVWDGHGTGGIVYERFHSGARLLPHR